MDAVSGWSMVPVGVLVSVLLARHARRADVALRARSLHPRRLRIPAPIRSRLLIALARADLAVGPEDAVGRLAIAALATAVLTAAIAPGLALPAAVAVLVAGPVWLRLARDRADRRSAAELPGALDRTAAVLRAGGTVGEAVEVLAGGSGPVAADLRRVRARVAMGSGLVAALGRWPVDRPVPGVRAGAGALALAVELGGACAEAIEGLASSLRERDGAIREALALSAQARVSAVVVGLAPLGYLLLAAMADPESLRVLLGTGIGRACLVLGLALEVAGAAWMRTMLRAER